MKGERELDEQKLRKEEIKRLKRWKIGERVGEWND